MKLLIAIFTTVLSLMNTQTKAAEETKVSAAVLASFQSNFKNVCAVAWKTTGQYYKADFNMNEQYASAYYDASARLIAVTRNVSSLQLPITLQANLKRDFETFWISDLFELSDEHGTSYYVTVENADSKIVLKSNDNNEWEQFKKLRKS